MTVRVTGVPWVMDVEGVALIEHAGAIVVTVIVKLATRFPDGNAIAREYAVVAVGETVIVWVLADATQPSDRDNSAIKR